MAPDAATSRRARPSGSFYRRAAQRQALSLEIRALETKLQRQRADKRRLLENAVLQALAERQQRLLAGGHGLLASWTMSPLHTYMHLPSDQAERAAYLQSIHAGKMHFTFEFLCHRFAGYDTRCNYVSSQVSELPDGDSIVSVADITPLKAARTVAQALGAFRFFANFQEMVMAEQLNVVAVREDESDQSFANAVSENRILATDYDGSETEKNVVVFTQLFSGVGASSDPVAVAVMDYVDQDEQFPYNGERRIRKEITSGVLFTQTASQSEPLTVSMLRFCFVRLRRPDPKMLPHDALLSRSMVDAWRLVLPLAMQDRLDYMNQI